MATKLGIIAGSGRFPLLSARHARAQGLTVVVAALRDNAAPELAEAADRIEWFGVTQIGKVIAFLQREAVDEAILAGGVDKKVIYSPGKLFRHLPDARSLKLWYNQVKDHRDASILSAAIAELESDGISVVSSIKYLPDCLASAGPMTRRRPTAHEDEDIAFGAHVAAVLADLDVGQSIVVKDRVVVAVEAIEGTDEAIRRGGGLARGGAVLVKFSRTHQDMRFDVPTIGPHTVAVGKESGFSIIAVEAGRTLMLDREQLLADADRAGIAVCGIARGQAASS